MYINIKNGNLTELNKYLKHCGVNVKIINNKTITTAEKTLEKITAQLKELGYNDIALSMIENIINDINTEKGFYSNKEIITFNDVFKK